MGGERSGGQLVEGAWEGLWCGRTSRIVMCGVGPGSPVSVRVPRNCASRRLSFPAPGQPDVRPSPCARARDRRVASLPVSLRQHVPEAISRMGAGRSFFLDGESAS